MGVEVIVSKNDLRVELFGAVLCVAIAYGVFSGNVSDAAQFMAEVGFLAASSFAAAGSMIVEAYRFQERTDRDVIPILLGEYKGVLVATAVAVVSLAVSLAALYFANAGNFDTVQTLCGAFIAPTALYGAITAFNLFTYSKE